ncbi:MAG TPA: transcriptional regulator [Candidatus Omnitrophica bacterium]|nr:transcriptional regulator [Candidatus Omnitrophota bacterium]
MIINFEDYEKENAFFKEQIENNIKEVIQLKSEYEHEKYIESFEKEFAGYNSSKYVIAVNSGTTALELALKASGIKPNDEVILPSYTYISTALAVSNQGCIPVFIDIKEDTLTMDPDRIEEKITKKTKAIIPVHIHGNPCEMDTIIKIARNNKLAIVEDCSHAHGAEYNNTKTGNFGIGCFSCHSSKILSGIGNSGLITTNDNKTYELIKNMLTVTNDPALTLSQRTPCTMDAMQAAVLRAKLPYLDKIIKRKRTLANNYIKTIPNDIKYQKEENKSKHAYRDFVILTENRDNLRQHLKTTGIETKVRYTTPLHLTQYYKNSPKNKKPLPITEKTFNDLLWLPISYVMTDKKPSFICDAIRNYKSA